MKDNGAWLTLGSVAVIAGLGLTRSGLIERGSRVVGSRVVVGPPGRGYSLPTHLGYGTYNVFQRYWYGQGDPLYALLSRRGPSVDWVTVFANRREIDRLKEVSEQILATSDDEAERWTAKQVIEHTVPLARAYGLQPQGGSAALRDLLDKHGAPPQQADLWQAQRRRQLTFVDRPSIPWDATWFQKLPPDTEFRSRGISIFGGMLVYDVSTEIVFDERGEPWTQYNLYLLDNGDGRTPVRRQDVAEWVVEPGRAVNTWAGAAHIEIRKPWEGWLTIRYLLPGRRYVVRVDPADLTERDANRYAQMLRQHGFREVRSSLTKAEWQILLSYPTYHAMEADEQRWRPRTKKERYELYNAYDREFGENAPTGGVFQWTKKGDKLKLVVHAPSR